MTCFLADKRNSYELIVWHCYEIYTTCTDLQVEIADPQYENLSMFLSSKKYYSETPKFIIFACIFFSGWKNLPMLTKICTYHVLTLDNNRLLLDKKYSQLLFSKKL